MARRKGNGKHAAKHQDMPVTAKTYSRDNYGSQARLNYSKNSGSRRSRKNPWRVVFVVSLVVLIAALIGLGAIAFQYISQQRAYDDLEQYASLSDSENMTLADLTVDWDALRAVNPDIVAWIYVPDSPINYPVVQGDDNEEYLHKAFDGSTGWLASAGTIFLDSTNSSDFSDRNSALYGHHMNDGSMFASLSDWQNNDEFNAHRDIYVLTPQGNYRLKTFALVKTTGDDALVQTTFSSDESYRSYIQDKLDRSVTTQQGEVLSAADIRQSMLFSTCEYSQADGRAVLFAAVVETTVANDPYIASSAQGTTGISANESQELDSQYKEAA
ncbi:MAG: class B sortase [Eggerthellaceae bacterium]|nr:class B sortase [Eggerthellaceae bacterium]